MNVVTTTEHYVHWQSRDGDNHEVGVDSSAQLYVRSENSYAYFESCEIDNILEALTLIKEKITHG